MDDGIHTESVCKAAEAGNIARLWELAQAGARISAEHATMALMRTATQPQDRVAQTHGLVDFNEQGDTPSRALVHASGVKNWRMVWRLVMEGADVNTKDKEGMTAFMHAIQDDKYELVVFLVAKGAHVDATDGHGMTAFMQASRDDKREWMRFLMDHGADVNANDTDGFTALMLAIQRGQLDMVRFLVKLGVNMEAVGMNGATALIQAVREDKIEHAWFLLKYGANVNVQDEDGMTPLMYALQNGTPKQGKLLLQYKADIHLKDKHHRSALHYAASGNNVDVAALLLDKGAKVDAVDKDLRTALHYAASGNNMDLTTLLLDRGANVNAMDLANGTVLHCAASGNHVDVAKLLLDRGAYMDIMDKHDRSALHYAASGNNQDVATLLLDRGACMDTMSRPMHYANWGTSADVKMLANKKTGNNKAPPPEDAASLAAPVTSTAAGAMAAELCERKKYTQDDFEVLATLGKGTFARVRLVCHRGQGSYYALKILKKSEVMRMRQLHHIKCEVEILSKIEHPFIVNYMGHFQDEKRLFLVLEYVQGGELFSYLRRQGRLTDNVSCYYASQLVLALSYLHAQHIIYRGLKPEDLLISADGTIKMTDFGFAKIAKDRTWTLCGTREYLAPEVIISKGSDKAVDWWALGVLIYEMLAGYPPFSGETSVVLYEKILTGKVEYPKYFSAKARDLIAKLLSVDPTKRLGCLRGGSEDVKKHRYFTHVDWESVLSKREIPPYVPHVDGPGDHQHFAEYPNSPVDDAVALDGEDKAAFDEIFDRF